MKSPFPGMDPYLEAPRLWWGMQHQLLSGIVDYLQPQLLPDYVTLLEERVLLGPLDERFLDGPIVEEGRLRVGAWENASASSYSQPECIHVPGLLYRHRSIEIRRRHDGELVSIIEIICPWDKIGRGRQEYRAMQEGYLRREINLVEIDLLREGEHTIALPANRLGPSDYRISVLPGGSCRFRVYRFAIRDRLPIIAVPLRDEDPDVALDLQRVLQLVYAEGPYSNLDYSVGPDPPLSPENTEWARDRIEVWREEQATNDR